MVLFQFLYSPPKEVNRRLRLIEYVISFRIFDLGIQLGLLWQTGAILCARAKEFPLYVRSNGILLQKSRCNCLENGSAKRRLNRIARSNQHNEDNDSRCVVHKHRYLRRGAKSLCCLMNVLRRFVW
jgi:hypothetical protein